MKKSELKQLIRQVATEIGVSKKPMYKIMRRRHGNIPPPPPSMLMTYGQTANWVNNTAPGFMLNYIIVPEDELTSELYKKMKLI